MFIIGISAGGGTHHTVSSQQEHLNEKLDTAPVSSDATEHSVSDSEKQILPQPDIIPNTQSQALLLPCSDARVTVNQIVAGVYIGIARGFVFSPYSRKCSFYFHFQVKMITECTNYNSCTYCNLMPIV